LAEGGPLAVIAEQELCVETPWPGEIVFMKAADHIIEQTLQVVEIARTAAL
jgi:hypothetical protein